VGPSALPNRADVLSPEGFPRDRAAVDDLHRLVWGFAYLPLSTGIGLRFPTPLGGMGVDLGPRSSSRQGGHDCSIPEAVLNPRLLGDIGRSVLPLNVVGKSRTSGRRSTRPAAQSARTEAGFRAPRARPDRASHARGRRFETRRARRRTTYCRSTSALKLLRPCSRLLPFMRLTMSASATLPNTPPGSA
jgi:hypothetical protein